MYALYNLMSQIVCCHTTDFCVICDPALMNPAALQGNALYSPLKNVHNGTKKQSRVLLSANNPTVQCATFDRCEN